MAEKLTDAVESASETVKAHLLETHDLGSCIIFNVPKPAAIGGCAYDHGQEDYFIEMVMIGGSGAFGANSR